MQESVCAYLFLNPELFPVADHLELHAQIPTPVSHRESQRHSQTAL